MKYLYPGNQSQNRFDLLLSLTSIRSEDIKAAVEDVLVKGHQPEMAASFNGVKLSNLERALNTLEAVENTIEAIKDEDWERFRKNSL